MGCGSKAANIASGGIYGAVTGNGIPGWVDYVPGVGDVARTIEKVREGDYWGALDRSVDPFGGVHNISGWLGEHTLPNEVRGMAPAVGGVIGNYVGGPWVGAIGAGIGSELAGVDAKQKYKNAGMAFAGGYLGKGISGGGWDFGGVSGGTAAGGTTGAAGSGPSSTVGPGVSSTSTQGSLAPSYTSTLVDTGANTANNVDYSSMFSTASGGAGSTPYSLGAEPYTSTIASGAGAGAGAGATTSGAGSSVPQTNYPYSLGDAAQPYNYSMTDIYAPPYNYGENGYNQYKADTAPDYTKVPEYPSPANQPYSESFTNSKVNPTMLDTAWETAKGWGEQGYDKATDYTKQKWNSWFGSEQPASTAGQNVGAKATGGKGMLQSYGLPLAVLGGLNYYGSQQNKKMAEDLYNQQKADIAAAQAQALANYQQYAFPNKEAVASARATGKSNIAESTKTARKSLDESLAARGIAGGGVAAGEYSKIERDKMKRMAELANQLTQYANTPYGPPPIMTAYPQMPQYTPWQTSLANTGNQLAGMYMMNQMLRG